MLWITGDAGVGKSAVAEWLCDKRPEIAAYHFCRFGNSDRVDTLVMRGDTRAVVDEIRQLDGRGGAFSLNFQYSRGWQVVEEHASFAFRLNDVVSTSW